MMLINSDGNGSSPAWLVNEGVSVDISQLMDFAEQITAELNQNFIPSCETGILPMMREPATFGLGGLKEGKFFRSAHDLSAQAVSQLLAEVGQGLGALAIAATNISLQYMDGDAFAQATIDQVYAAFEPPEATGEESETTDTQEADEDENGDEDPLADLDPATITDGQETIPGDPNAAQIIAEGTDGAYTVHADDDLPQTEILPNP